MKERSQPPKPTEVELELLQVLREKGGATVREIFEVVSQHRSLGYTSVLKMLQIMTEKGLVERTEAGKAHIYRAVASQEETLSQMLRDLSERLFAGICRAACDARTLDATGERGGVGRDSQNDPPEGEAMSETMEILGWTLVHFCWQAALIALLYRAVDLVFAKSRSHVRYGLALVALMSMLAVALATLRYEAKRLSQRNESAYDAVATVPLEMASHPASQSSREIADASQSAAQMEVAGYLVNAMPLLDTMWLAGVLIFSLRTASGLYVIGRLRRSGLVKVPAEVYAMFARMVERAGVRRRIDLYLSECVSGPMAMGIMRSVVLLPVSALTHLSPEQLEVVLAHELAHIRRGDYVWNIVQTIVETLFFFHPAVWWVSANLRQQRELCCDDAALACCSDPVVYATALLRLEEQRSSKMRLAMALDGHRGGLKARIFRILGETPQRPIEVAPLSLVGVCAMVALFVLPLPRLFADHVERASQPIHAAILTAPQSAQITTDQSPSQNDSDSVKASEPARPTRARQMNPNARTGSPAELSVDMKDHVDVAPIVVAEVSQARTSPHALAMLAMGQSKDTPAKSDYIAEMRAAGYGDDLDRLMEMKIQGITPEYARSMQQLGFGKPTAQELISLQIFGVTPETVQSMKAAGLAPSKLQDLISYKIFKVTPEFVTGMKAAGFTDIPPSKLVELRVHGITPETAKATKQQFPDVTLDQLVQLRVFHIDENFIASAKQHGFNNLTIDKLVRLRMSGLLDDGTQKEEKK